MQNLKNHLIFYSYHSKISNQQLEIITEKIIQKKFAQNLHKIQPNLKQFYKLSFKNTLNSI